MKVTSRCFYCITLSLLLSTIASAQENEVDRMDIAVGLGYLSPQGKFASSAKPGFQLSGRFTDWQERTPTAIGRRLRLTYRSTGLLWWSYTSNM